MGDCAGTSLVQDGQGGLSILVRGILLSYVALEVVDVPSEHAGPTCFD